MSWTLKRRKFIKVNMEELAKLGGILGLEGTNLKEFVEQIIAEQKE